MIAFVLGSEEQNVWKSWMCKAIREHAQRANEEEEDKKVAGR